MSNEGERVRTIEDTGDLSEKSADPLGTVRNLDIQ